MRVLITGVAGFIGSQLARNLLTSGIRVTGVDCLSNGLYVTLKKDRLSLLNEYQNFSYQDADLSDFLTCHSAFEQGIDYVVHLAALAGVRPSIENSQPYVTHNLVALGNVLECCRKIKAKHVLFASSSAVYGNNTPQPFCIQDKADRPISMYAATKRAGELMVHAFSHAHMLPATCLRFFTVYGPWGRPDMAVYDFTRAILAGDPISVYNFGDMRRDFTYIDDVVEGIRILLGKIPAKSERRPSDTCELSGSEAPFRLYNIGNQSPVKLGDLIATLESVLGVSSVKTFLPLQSGDVVDTCANTEALEADTGFRPSTNLQDGIASFVKWYRWYHH